MPLARIFRVRSFPHPPFADQSADDASANVPNVSQVTFLFWPIASRYRYLKSLVAKSPVRRFPHTSFANQSADDPPVNVPNDSQVTFLFWPIASRYRSFVHHTLESLVSVPHPSFADQSADDASANVA